MDHHHERLVLPFLGVSATCVRIHLRFLYPELFVGSSFPYRFQTFFFGLFLVFVDVFYVGGVQNVSVIVSSLWRCLSFSLLLLLTLKVVSCVKQLNNLPIQRFDSLSFFVIHLGIIARIDNFISTAKPTCNFSIVLTLHKPSQSFLFNSLEIFFS